MQFQPVLLISDALLWLLMFVIAAFIVLIRRREHLLQPWRQVFRRRVSTVTFIVIAFFAVIALLDSLHFRMISHSRPQQIQSVLDKVLSPLITQQEKTYSSPFSVAFSKNTPSVHAVIVFALIKSLVLSLLGSFIFFVMRKPLAFWQYACDVISGSTRYAIREMLLTIIVLVTLSVIALDLSQHYHILGADKVGRDTFFETIKSIRTGLVIGSVTTLLMLPFGLVLGTLAGFFGGFIDDAIQYIYTTLSSIPGVLLITAAIMALQIFIANHAELFSDLESRADARLVALCIVLGITSWTGLCRLIRGETLKVREIDYVHAAKTLGTSRFNIILRHIIPNVMHIVLITVVLDFSGLVLAEAVLSYVGVGVDPTTMSWGNMINSARLELAREPIVWWPLVAAFIMMFSLVLSANLFSDAVRDAFDPKLRHEV